MFIHLSHCYIVGLLFCVQLFDIYRCDEIPDGCRRSSRDEREPVFTPLRITDVYGEISSPNYPEDYIDDICCRWRIRAPTDFNITIGVFVVFDFPVLVGPACFDYIKIKYVDTGAEFRYCGNSGGSMPPTLGRIQNTREIEVIFATDFSGTYKGFRMRFNFEGIPFTTLSTAAPTEISTLKPYTGCRYKNNNGSTASVVLSSEEGSLSSPNYPNSSPLDILCRWIIQKPTRVSEQLSLSFTDFDFDSTGCTHYLELQMPTLAPIRYCGNQKPTLSVMSQYGTSTVTVTFESFATPPSGSFAFNYSFSTLTTTDSTSVLPTTETTTSYTTTTTVPTTSEESTTFSSTMTPTTESLATSTAIAVIPPVRQKIVDETAVLIISLFMAATISIIDVIIFMNYLGKLRKISHQKSSAAANSLEMKSIESLPTNKRTMTVSGLQNYSNSHNGITPTVTGSDTGIQNSTVENPKVKTKRIFVLGGTMDNHQTMKFGSKNQDASSDSTISSAPLHKRNDMNDLRILNQENSDLQTNSSKFNHDKAHAMKASPSNTNSAYVDNYPDNIPPTKLYTQDEVDRLIKQYNIEAKSSNSYDKSVEERSDKQPQRTSDKALVENDQENQKNRNKCDSPETMSNNSPRYQSSAYILLSGFQNTSSDIDFDDSNLNHSDTAQQSATSERRTLNDPSSLTSDAKKRSISNSRRKSVDQSNPNFQPPTSFNRRSSLYSRRHSTNPSDGLWLPY